MWIRNLLRLICLLSIVVLCVNCGPSDNLGDPKNNGGGGSGGDNTGGGGGTNEDDDSFILPNTNDSGASVFLQYETYYFKDAETRDIVIIGPYNTADPGKTAVLWYDNPTTGDIKEESIGKDENIYIDETNNYFVAIIAITTSYNIDAWKNVEFHVGPMKGVEADPVLKSSCFNISKINNEDKREMKIHYAYMQGADILAYNTPNPKTVIEEAFAKCNTDIIYENVQTTSLEQESFLFESYDDQTAKLMTFFENHKMSKLLWEDLEEGYTAKHYLVGLPNFGITINEDVSDAEREGL